MSRVLSLVFGVIAYAVFLLTMAYAVGFVGNAFVPKTLDFGPVATFRTALLINLVLLALFGVQHSVMARPWFKQWLHKFVPDHLERATYMLLSSIVLCLLFWQWKPMPAMIFSTESDLVATILIVLFWAGWVIAFVNSIFVDHLDAFGLRQAQVMDGEGHAAGPSQTKL